jgi:hypothetical protein
MSKYVTKSDHYDNFLGCISRGSEFAIKMYPGFFDEALVKGTTYVEALKKMEEKNKDLFLMVDEKHILCGSISKNQIMTKILLLMTN